MTISIHVGDVGTALELTISQVRIVDDVEVKEPLDVSLATAMYVLLESPTGIVKRLTATFVTNGVDGIIEAVTEDGTIDEAGTWKMQGYIEFGVSKFHADKRNFSVVQPLVYTP
jgi:hypothetical protein